MALTDRTVVLVASTRKCITGLCSKTCRHCSSLARGASAAPSWLFISAISRLICSAAMPAAWRSPLQIHAADFDAGLAALLAADPLTTSVIQIAFCGSVERLALVLRKEHQSQKIRAAVSTGAAQAAHGETRYQPRPGTKQLIQRSLPEPEVRRQGFPVPYCPVPVLTKWEIRRQHPDRHGGWPSTASIRPHRAGEIRRAERARRAGKTLTTSNVQLVPAATGITENGATVTSAVR